MKTSIPNLVTLMRCEKLQVKLKLKDVWGSEKWNKSFDNPTLVQISNLSPTNAKVAHSFHKCLIVLIVPPESRGGHNRAGDLLEVASWHSGSKIIPHPPD